MAGLHQNIQYLGAGGMYGTNTTYGGGGVPVARSELDFLRMGVGREPGAEYPDGYLGTINSRRGARGKANGASERALEAVQARVTQRSYQRGVHRGERIDPGDYYYPDNLRNDRGILRQMRATMRQGNVYQTPRSAPAMELVPAPHLPNDGKANMRSTSPGEIDARRATQLSKLKPRWS
jgi:hypothetical protein